MNVSLMWNLVGFYQIVKLSMIPESCLFEVAFDKIRYSRDTKLSILVVLLGVAVRTVTDVNAKGFAAAFIVVLSSALQQYYVHYLQRKYSLSSFNLLGHTAPIQANLKYVIKKKYGQDAANVGDEGGFAPITFRKIKKVLSL